MLDNGINVVIPMGSVDRPKHQMSPGIVGVGERSYVNTLKNKKKSKNTT